MRLTDRNRHTQITAIETLGLLGGFAGYTGTPAIVREIAKGWHDLQLNKILEDRADPRLIAAVLDRIKIINRHSL